MCNNKWSNYKQHWKWKGFKGMHIFQRMIFRKKLEFLVSYFPAANLLMTSIVLKTLVHRKIMYICISLDCVHGRSKGEHDEFLQEYKPR